MNKPAAKETSIVYVKSTKCNDATSVQGETSVYDEISTQCNPLYISKTNVVNNKMDRCLKILGLNVCGLQCRLDQCIIQDYVKDLDILCFSETKLDKIDEDNIILPILPVCSTTERSL